MHDVIQAFHHIQPGPAEVEQRVSFGTSGHRGTSLQRTFNADHIFAIVQAVVDYRRQAGYSVPLFLGLDTHALSRPAWECSLQVLIANGVEVWAAKDDGFTARPLVSHAILQHNARFPGRLADGLIITPSHNPPEDGGIKYNPAHGGPADTETTDWIQRRANYYLKDRLQGVNIMPPPLAHPVIKEHDFIRAYVAELAQVVDMAAIAKAGLRLGADPMGGTALPVWQAIAEHYALDLTVVNTQLDERFAFMPPDHDGKIRMDCSSSAAMANLLANNDRFDLAFGNDPDVDRHGIVDARRLMKTNHFLAVCIDYKGVEHLEALIQSTQSLMKQVLVVE